MSNMQRFSVSVRGERCSVSIDKHTLLTVLADNPEYVRDGKLIKSAVKAHVEGSYLEALIEEFGGPNIVVGGRLK